MSTLNVTNITNGTSTASTETVVKGAAKAWVNFNGTGTVTIRDSFNVSSITDVGTGNYQVNFTTSMPNANYCANVSCSDDVLPGVSHGTIYVPEQATGYVEVLIHNPQNFSNVIDKPIVNVAVFSS